MQVMRLECWLRWDIHVACYARVLIDVPCTTYAALSVVNLKVSDAEFQLQKTADGNARLPGADDYHGAALRCHRIR